MSVWGCDVCRYVGTPTNVSESKEEWGTETTLECPHCESVYCNGEIVSRAEGDCCAFCGEFVEKLVELNLGGSEPDMVCRECKGEHNV